MPIKTYGTYEAFDLTCSNLSVFPKTIEMYGKNCIYGFKSMVCADTEPNVLLAWAENGTIELSMNGWLLLAAVEARYHVSLSEKQLFAFLCHRGTQGNIAWPDTKETDKNVSDPQVKTWKDHFVQNRKDK